MKEDISTKETQLNSNNFTSPQKHPHSSNLSF